MVEFPQDDWSPKQIRRYIKHILVTKHDMDPLAADEAAEKWKMGRGRDLLSWDRHSFQKTFSDEVGPHLYRTVYEEEYSHWKTSKEGLAYRCEMTPWANFVTAFLVSYSALLTPSGSIDRLQPGYIPCRRVEFLVAVYGAGIWKVRL